MPMRKWIAEDFKWKIFSLILAVVVWLIVNRIRSGTVATGLLAVSNTFTNVPVQVVSANADVNNARVAPASISVTVSGAPGVIAVLQTNQLRAIVDLTGIDAAHDLKQPVNVMPPPFVTILKIAPPDVTITISTNQ